MLVNCFGSTFHLRSATRLMAPFTPNDVTSSPVRASRQISRSRLLMKMRSLLPSALSRHAATPRWTNPVPFGTWPAS